MIKKICRYIVIAFISASILTALTYLNRRIDNNARLINNRIETMNEMIEITTNNFLQLYNMGIYSKKFNELNFTLIKYLALQQEAIKENIIKPEFNKLKDANVVIINLEAKAQGSGVIIKVTEDYSYILTAAHVIKKAKRVLITKDEEFIVGTVLDTNEKLDLGLIEIKWNLGEAIPLAKEPPKFGETVYSVSNPSGMECIVFEGKVGKRCKSEELGNVEYETDTLDTIYGSSGGMVTNSKGELIGIVSKGILYPLMKEFPLYAATAIGLNVTLEDIKYFLLGLVDFEGNNDYHHKNYVERINQ